MVNILYNDDKEDPEMKLDGSLKSLIFLLAVYFLVSTVFKMLPDAPGFLVIVLAGIVIIGLAIPNRRNR
jgi:hypothetical protein